MSDETKTGVELEAERLLDHLTRQLSAATPAPEPGDPAGTEIARTLDDGGESVPLPIAVANRAESAGYTWVYDTETGARSQINNNMLRAQLRKMKKTRDGREVPVFTTIKPMVAPKEGTIKCLLHPDHDDHDEVAEYGFPPCYKANLVSQYSLDTHMRHRHPQEWATITEARERREADEQRAERRALIALAGRMDAATERDTRRPRRPAGGDETAA